jgi:antitoxin VapB
LVIGVFQETSVARTTVFKNNRTQAVRLPKALALDEGVREVEIVMWGKGRLILPVDAVWDDFFDEPGVTDDFLVERDQPAVQQRDAF